MSKFATVRKETKVCKKMFN